MTKDQVILSRIEDRLSQCSQGYYVTSTGLLDSHEQAIAMKASRNIAGVRALMYGGYEGAERRMLVCIPAEIPMTDEEATEGLLAVLRVDKPAISRELSHRDYLGSLLGLGIDRSVTGDILVRPDGADIIIVPEIAEFLLSEYRQVGRTVIKTSLVPIGELILPEAKTQVIKDTVPSVRLDSVVASSFKLPRNKAAEAVKSGLVSVDHIENLKPDARVDEGAVIVLRGKGKAVLTEIGGESKKGRLWIKIERYL